MKHNTSSLFKLLLTLALIVAALLPQRAEAASSSLSGDSTVQAGSTVTLTRSISGSNVMGIEATLEYDSNTLEFTNYDQKISGWTMDYNSNHFLLYGVSNPINSSTGVLTVTFRVKSGLASGTALTAGFKNIVVSDGSKDETVSGTSWTGSVATPPSSNCDLSSLTCSNATLSPAFNKSTTNYTATVPYAVESLNLSYKAADGSARVSVSGNTLVVGSNTVTVTCTAATGAKKNYTITVTREQDPNYKPSTDALLKELTLDVVASAQNPGMNPQLLVAALARHFRHLGLHLLDVLLGDVQHLDNEIICQSVHAPFYFHSILTYIYYIKKSRIVQEKLRKKRKKVGEGVLIGAAEAAIPQSPAATAPLQGRAFSLSLMEGGAQRRKAGYFSRVFP